MDLSRQFIDQHAESETLRMYMRLDGELNIYAEQPLLAAPDKDKSYVVCRFRDLDLKTTNVTLLQKLICVRRRLFGNNNNNIIRLHIKTKMLYSYSDIICAIYNKDYHSFHQLLKIVKERNLSKGVVLRFDESGRNILLSYLWYALNEGTEEMCKELYAGNYPLCEQKLQLKKTDFHHPSVMEKMKWLLTWFDGSTLDGDGYNFLIAAVRDNNLEVVRKLITSGMSMNFMASDGNTAISMAKTIGNIEMIDFLETCPVIPSSLDAPDDIEASGEASDAASAAALGAFGLSSLSSRIRRIFTAGGDESIDSQDEKVGLIN